MLPDLSHWDVAPEKVAVILVDHGSRREESNQLLLEVTEVYRQQSDWAIVEPAHMELAEPSIATAFNRCAERGAELVIVFPYFLGPGRHSREDIPHLSAKAAEAWPAIRYLVTAPFGLHASMLEVTNERIAEALNSPRNC